MDDMVERVARAIQGVTGGLNYDYADFCRDAARAAIAAMREPTEAMLISRGIRGKIRAREDWQDMIDAALTKPTNPEPTASAA